MAFYLPKKRYRVWQLPLTTLAAFTLTGCISDNRAYPARWGERPVAAANTCAGISGAYRGCEFDNGNRMEQGSCLLLFWNRFEQKEFASGNTFDARDAHVTIEQTADQLHVAYFADGKTLAKKDLLKDKKGGFSCTAEGINVSNGSEAFQQNLLGYMPGTYTLIKDNEGRLIVRTKSSGGGLELGVIPVAGRETSWMRVDSYAAEAPTSPEARAATQRKKASLEARYEATDRETVTDSATGLEWTQSDSGGGVDWKQSKQWCNSRGGGWRLATIAELEGIFDSSGTLSTPCGRDTCKVSSKFHLSDSLYRTSEHDGSEAWLGSQQAWGVDLRDGNRLGVWDKAYQNALC